MATRVYLLCRTQLAALQSALLAYSSQFYIPARNVLEFSSPTLRFVANVKGNPGVLIAYLYEMATDEEYISNLLAINECYHSYYFKIQVEWTPQVLVYTYKKRKSGYYNYMHTDKGCKEKQQHKTTTATHKRNKHTQNVQLMYNITLSLQSNTNKSLWLHSF